MWNKLLSLFRTRDGSASSVALAPNDVAPSARIGPSAKIENASVTFAVDDVAPASSPLNTCKPLEAVRALLEAAPESFAADESSQGNPTHGHVEACWSYALDCVAGIGHHPLIAAAHLAFSQHRPSGVDRPTGPAIMTP
jgi:hypothetical protein